LNPLHAFPHKSKYLIFVDWGFEVNSGMHTAIQTPTVTAADVEAARKRIAPYVRKTPLMRSEKLSAITGVETYLKLENKQEAGSFKPRISFSKLLTMSDEQRARGVVASTAGGHGMGLSFAGSKLGVPVHIHLPHSADATKVDFMKRHGARLTFFSSVEEARLAATERARLENLTFISAYNDPSVIAGGGTVALEILEDDPQIDLIVVGVGGGGIASGMGIALAAARPDAQVWGVQPESNAVLRDWLEARRPVDGKYSSSIADGLGAEIERDSLTFPLAQRYVPNMLTVTDAEIIDAMSWLQREHDMVIEPSGAAPIAAMIKTQLPGWIRQVAVVITGGNISPKRFGDLLSTRQ
jgi:threonine dehydratase